MSQKDFFLKTAYVSHFKIGLYFGSGNLVALMCSPVFAMLAGRIGDFWKKQYYQANKPHFQHNPGLRNMLVYGALASALQGVAFGFLPYTKDLETFIIVSYCLRLLAEAADVAVYVAVLAMVIAVFPESVASKMAICETFLGVGLCLGLRQIEVFAI